MIKFDIERDGIERRRKYPHLATKYPNCVPIERVQLNYTISKKGTGSVSNTATLHQFPFVVCFSATTHKFQGMAI